MNEPAYVLKMTGQVRIWLHELRHADRESSRRVSAALDALREDGPSLGRPLVDRIGHSQLHNLKELRPCTSRNDAIRILFVFVFDPERAAVLLVAGNKAGNWRRWYDDAIPAAEAAYADYLKELSS